MPIQELARDVVVQTSPDASIVSLAHRMRDEQVGSVVNTNDQRPRGIVTDRDLTTRIPAEETDPADLTAEDVMSPELCTVGPRMVSMGLPVR